MLLVPTVVRPSPIAGLGLFSAGPIPAGTTIWVFNQGVDWRFDRRQLDAFPDGYRELLEHWSYEEVEGVFVLCGDNAKFMNHSFDPNCLDLPPEITVTRRAIEADEELTCDYRMIDVSCAKSGLRDWMPRAVELDRVTVQ